MTKIRSSVGGSFMLSYLVEQHEDEKDDQDEADAAHASVAIAVATARRSGR